MSEIEGAGGGEGEVFGEDLAALGVGDGELWFDGSGEVEVIFFEVTDEALEVDGFSRAVESPIGEEVNEAAVGRCFAPLKVDWKAPHRDGGEGVIEGEDDGVSFESGPELTVILVAGKSGGSVGIGGCFFERLGVFAEEGEFDTGEGLPCFAGVGVEEGGVGGEFPGEADVGELNEGLDDFFLGIFEIGMDRLGSGDGDEKRAAGLILRKVFTPVEGVGVGGVELILDDDFLVDDNLAGDEFEGEGNPAFDPFVVGAVAGVMAIAKGGPDEVFGRKALNAEAERLVVDGLNLVGAGAVGELGFVVAGENDVGGEAGEFEGVCDAFAQGEPVRAMERVRESDLISVPFAEVAGDGDIAATVIEGCLEIFDLGRKFDMFQKILRLEVEGKRLVQAHPDRARDVGSGGGVNGGGDEGDDVADAVVIDAIGGGGVAGIWKVVEATKGPLVSDGKWRDGFDDDGVFDDCRVGRFGVSVAERLSGEAFLPVGLVVVAAAEISPSGFAGAGGDDLGFLVFGFRAHELKERSGGDRVDGVVKKEELSSGSAGTDSTGSEDAEGLG